LSAARSVAEIAEHFSSAPFAVVRDAIELVGGSWSISAQGDGTLCAPPTNGEATIIVQGVAPGRRFGLVLLTGGWALRGLRGKKFRIDDLRDESQNSDFLVELRRRLSCPGLSQGEALDAGEHNRASRWKGRGEKFKALGRGGKLSGGRGVWDAAAY
jgi:hypothetical protein